MSDKLTFFVAIIIVILLFSILYKSPYHKSSSIENVTVSATISTLGSGKNVSINIFGYTSPIATVNVTGKGVSNSTVADTSGYFSIPNSVIFEDTKEICIYARDKDGRISQNTCIPVYFSTDLKGIGPIILSPTFTVAKREFAPDEKIQFSGQTVPNKTVRINLSSSLESKSKNNTIVKYETTSKDDGSFNLTTSSSTPKKQQAYSTTQFDGKNSPKSTTLTIEIIPWWLVILKSFLKIFAKYLLEFALITEIIIALLYYLNFKKRISHPLAIHQSKSLARINASIVPFDKHSLVVS